MTKSDAFDTLSAILDAEAEKTPTTVRESEPDWKPLCVCGHLQEHHSSDVGGTHPEVDTGGMPYYFDGSGCTGAMRSLGRRKSAVSEGRVQDRVMPFKTAEGAVVMKVPGTCPCTEFRRVAEVNRLGGRFRQRSGKGAHPMASGLRGLVKITNRMAEKQGVAPVEVFDTRFRWTVPLVCAQCASTDDVFPGYTVGGRDSALLCTECRDKARATLIL